jgi:hypothetical protein
VTVSHVLVVRGRLWLEADHGRGGGTMGLVFAGIDCTVGGCGLGMLNMQDKAFQDFGPLTEKRHIHFYAYSQGIPRERCSAGVGL